jgi:hypothetical protein
MVSTFGVDISHQQQPPPDGATTEIRCRVMMADGQNMTSQDVVQYIDNGGLVVHACTFLEDDDVGIRI